MITRNLRGLALVLSTFALVGCSGGPAVLTRTSPKRLLAHRPAVRGTQGLVTSGNSLASMAGLRILMKGGNAADAAVAVLATLNLVEPLMSGAGGNGFMTIYDKATDRVYSLNATGAAPAALDPTELSPEAMMRGLTAGVVPGLFGGWIALLDRFGTLSLSEVLEPAIDYAENGHPLDASVARAIASQRALLERFPTTARIFLPGGRVPTAGQMFTARDLAHTFRKVVESEQTALGLGKSRSDALQAAFDRFYRGDIAQEMARFYRAMNGLFSAEDFASYKPLWTEPVHVKYRGYDVYTSPPTSRGGLEVVMQLQLIEGYDVKGLGHNSAETLHLIIECIKLAKSDIYHFVADPRLTDVPLVAMTSKEYATARRERIERDRARVYPDHGDPLRHSHGQDVGSVGTRSPLPRRPAFPEMAYEGSTTSFSVADRFGNVVACTPTLGSGWGTGVIVGNTGLFFNNGTRIGSTSPYPDNVNYVRGGQIPLLNNSPIIVMKDGEFILSLGTPGGETIGQTQFQVLLKILDFGMGIQEAIEAPRLSLHADPNFYKPGAAIKVRVEGRVAPEVTRDLVAKGHVVEMTAEFAIGNMQGILKHPETGTMTAGADPRRTGYAVGW